MRILAAALFFLVPFALHLGAQPSIEKLWTSTFAAPSTGDHDTITVETNKKGNSVQSVEYSTNGGQSWTMVSFTVVENGTPTVITVAPGVIPNNADVRVQGSNANSKTDPTPPGSIN